MDITELLAFSAKEGASDLHISAGLPPIIRIDGDVRRINLPAMEHRQVHSLSYEIMNDKQRRDYEEFLGTDFSFKVPGVARIGSSLLRTISAEAQLVVRLFFAKDILPVKGFSLGWGFLARFAGLVRRRDGQF